jgi:hypothetical protein
MNGELDSSLRGREADRSFKQSHLEAQAVAGAHFGTRPARKDAGKTKPHVDFLSYVLHEPIAAFDRIIAS